MKRVRSSHDTTTSTTNLPVTDKMGQDIGLILKKINDITRNQFIIDLMILIQGINFIIHPQTAHRGIIQSFAIVMFFAAISILAGFIITRGFKRRNFQDILLSFGFTALAVAVYFMAGVLAPVFHYFIAVVIIVTGINNILSAKHIIKLNRIKTAVKQPPKKNETVEAVSSALKQNVKLEAERVLSPAVAWNDKVARYRYSQLLINLVLIILGIAMLFFRFATNAILIRTSGVILIFSAVSDLIALIWTHRESELAKRFTHYLKRP